MSMNDRNDPNDIRALDNEGAPDGELSQDELDNVSGGRFAMNAEQPDGRLMAGKTDVQTDDDKNDLLSR